MRRVLPLILAPLEELFTKVIRTEKLHPQAEGLFLVSYHPYQGHPVTLPDGTKIQRGTPVGELHLANRRLVEIARQRKITEWSILRTLRNELLLLAKQLAGDKTSPAVTAFYGLSLMGAGAKRLGFYTRPVPSTMSYRLIAGWERLLSRAYALPFARTRARRELTEIWISRSQLLELLHRETCTQVR